MALPIKDDQQEPVITVLKTYHQDVAAVNNTSLLDSVDSDETRRKAIEAELAALTFSIPEQVTQMPIIENPQDYQEKKTDEVKITPQDIRGSAQTEIVFEQEAVKEEVVDKDKSQKTQSLSYTPQSKEEKVIFLEKEIEEIRLEKMDFEQKHKAFEIKESPIREKIALLTSEKNSLVTRLEPYTEREKVLEEKIRDIERQAHDEQDETKRISLKEERWSYAKERHELEADKWDIQKGLETLIIKIDEAEGELGSVRRQSQVIEIKISECDKKIEKKRLEIQLVSLSDHKQDLEKQWIALNEEKRKLEIEYDSIIKEEQYLEEEIQSQEHRELEALSSEAEREIEAKRWKYEEEWHATHAKSVDIKNKLERTISEISTLKPRYQKALEQEEQMIDKLQSM